MDEELVQLGLDIPFTQKMVKSLQAIGCNIPDQISEEDKLVDYIWKLLQRI